MNIFSYFTLVTYVAVAILAFYLSSFGGVDAVISSIIISVFPEISPKLKARPLLITIAVIVCFITYFTFCLIYNNEDYLRFTFFLLNLPIFCAFNYISNKMFNRDIVIVGWSGFNVIRSHTIVDISYSFVWLFLVIGYAYIF